VRKACLRKHVIDVLRLVVVLPETVGLEVELAQAVREPVLEPRQDDLFPKVSCEPATPLAWSARRLRRKSGLNSLNDGEEGPAPSRMERFFCARLGCTG